MKAAVIREFGDVSVLKYEDIETPKPKAGHIRWGQGKGLPTRWGDDSLQAHVESRKPNEEIGK